ncbi:MAG: alcohol dehydrogenase catalytic domain-containing protein [Caldilineaceae bacterium]
MSLRRWWRPWASALDGNFAPLTPGTRVAVDPAQPCRRCELCEQGHPNLCRRLRLRSLSRPRQLCE